MEKFDHPLLFIVFVTMAVVGMQAFGTWAAKSLGLNGLASLLQHP